MTTDEEINFGTLVTSPSSSSFNLDFGHDKGCNLKHNQDIKNFKMLSKKLPLDSEIENYSDICSTVGLEGNVWDERYFLENHMIKKKYTRPSAQKRRTTNLKLARYFCGQSGLYTGIVEDIKLSILCIREPQKLNTFMFEEFLGVSGEDLNTARTDRTAPPTEVKPALDILQTTQEETTSAENFDEELLLEVPSISSKEIAAFWQEISKILMSISEQGEVTPKQAICETIIGLYCLHSLKLITRSPESTFRSISNRLNQHFSNLYGREDWILDLIPPHQGAINSLHDTMKSMDSDVLEIVSILIGKVIMVNAQVIPNIRTKGVLYGSCLTHIGMFKLAPIKYVEQASMALNMQCREFCAMICTNMVKESLMNVISMLIEASKAPGKVTIFGVEYNLQSQISWRFCKLYNQQHYSRFNTSKNTRLILRCSAYLAGTARGEEITSMYLLKSSFNQRTFEAEKAMAQRNIIRINDDDKPLTKEAEKVYGKNMKRFS